jgi:hypothetical protein
MIGCEATRYAAGEPLGRSGVMRSEAFDSVVVGGCCKGGSGGVSSTVQTLTTNETNGSFSHG